MRDKGNRSRLECRKMFEGRNFKVAIVERTGKFVKERDMFGLFDLCCIREEEIIFVQVATNYNHTHAQYLEFKKEHPNIKVQQWVKVDHNGWRIFEYLENGERLEERIR